MSRRPRKIVEVRPDMNRAASVLAALRLLEKRTIETHGPELAGFAVVTWNMRGEADTILCCDHGPISECLLPTYVHDMLNRHAAANLIAPNLADEFGGA